MRDCGDDEGIKRPWWQFTVGERIMGKLRSGNGVVGRAEKKRKNEQIARDEKTRWEWTKLGLKLVLGGEIGLFWLGIFMLG
jgi:hypothetical protein